LAVCAVLIGPSLAAAVRRIRSPREAGRWQRGARVVVALCLGCAPGAAGQGAPAPFSTTGGRAPLASAFDVELFTAMAAQDTVFALLETMQAEAISSRISGGGIGFGVAPRVSGFGSSITQARYRIGDIDITDPSTGGVPLMVPELFLWRRVTVASGLSSLDL